MDITIGFDYRTFLMRIRSIKKAKNLIFNETISDDDIGYIEIEWSKNPYYDITEQANLTLNGEGPFYAVTGRNIYYAELITKPFKFEGVGHTAIFGGLKLEIVAHEYPAYYIAMLPGLGALLFYQLYRSTRWIDLIYRRFIVTAAVWGIAKVDHREIPHWGWITKQWKKND